MTAGVHDRCGECDGLLDLHVEGRGPGELHVIRRTEEFVRGADADEPRCLEAIHGGEVGTPAQWRSLRGGDRARWRNRRERPTVPRKEGNRGPGSARPRRNAGRATFGTVAPQVTLSNSDERVRGIAIDS